MAYEVRDQEARRRPEPTPPSFVQARRESRGTASPQPEAAARKTGDRSRCSRNSTYLRSRTADSAASRRARTEELQQQVAVVADRQAGERTRRRSQTRTATYGSARRRRAISCTDRPAGSAAAGAQERAVYTVTLNIFLRSGLPDETYVQQPSVGVVAPNSRVAGARPAGPLRTSDRTAILAQGAHASHRRALPTVYFQYTAAPKVTAPAQALIAEAQGDRLQAAGRGTRRGRAGQARGALFLCRPTRTMPRSWRRTPPRRCRISDLPDKPPVTTRLDAGFLRQEERARRARIVARPRARRAAAN